MPVSVSVEREEELEGLLVRHHVPESVQRVLDLSGADGTVSGDLSVERADLGLTLVSPLAADDQVPSGGHSGEPSDHPRRVDRGDKRLPGEGRGRVSAGDRGRRRVGTRDRSRGVRAGDRGHRRIGAGDGSGRVRTRNRSGRIGARDGGRRIGTGVGGCRGVARGGGIRGTIHFLLCRGG